MTKKIDKMHELFGVTEGKKCKDCDHLCYYEASKRWYKCGIYGNTSSEATDWRLSYDACGLWNREVKPMNPIVNLNKGKRKEPEQPMEGQMTLWD